MKKRKRRIFLIAGMCFFLVLALLVPGTVRASGLVSFVQDASHQYSSYNLENYDLDFYVDMSWTWLPWNWTDGIGRSVMHGVYLFTNALWGLSRWLSFGTGEIVTEAYRFDIINELADSIGSNMQKLAGISPTGFSTNGFYPGFIMLILVVLGVYVTYVGLYKRETSKAISAVVNAVLIFIFTTALIVYAPTCIRSINEFSTDISAGALEIGTGIVVPGAETGEGDSVDRIRDQLFNVQVYQPWLILQFGTTDVNAIGADRVNNLLSVSPDADYGQTREAVVKTEIETYGNTRLTVTKVGERFGMVLLILFVNLLISVFVILLSGMMIISQLLFIVYVMFLVVSFALSMFPTCSGVAKKAVLKVFNIIMVRAGYVLLITITFMISSMIYSIAGNHSFFTIGFLQIIVYAGVFLNKNEILEFMSLQSDRGIAKIGAVGGLLAYQKMRRAGMRHEKRQERRREWVKGKVKDAASAGWQGVKSAGNKAMDHRAALYMREQAAQRSWKTAQMRQNLDYRAAASTPNVSGADFYTKRSQKDATSGQIYDKYFNRMHGRDLGRADKPHYDAPYRVARQTPDVASAKFERPAEKETGKKYKRPELWQRRLNGTAVREKYQGNTYKPREAGAQPSDDMTGAEMAASSGQGRTTSGETRKYHVAKRTDAPQLEHAKRTDAPQPERANRKDAPVKTSGRGTAGEPQELVTTARIRTQEGRTDMSMNTKENGNWSRTSKNWRTSGSDNLKPQEISRRNVEHRGSSKGNWKGK